MHGTRNRTEKRSRRAIQTLPQSHIKLQHNFFLFFKNKGVTRVQDVLYDHNILMVPSYILTDSHSTRFKKTKDQLMKVQFLHSSQQRSWRLD